MGLWGLQDHWSGQPWVGWSDGNRREFRVGIRLPVEEAARPPKVEPALAFGGEVHGAAKATMA